MVMTRAAFSLRVKPISLPPVSVCHSAAAPAMVLVLPAPAGAVSRAMARSAVSRLMIACR